MMIWINILFIYFLRFFEFYLFFCKDRAGGDASAPSLQTPRCSPIWSNCWSPAPWAIFNLHCGGPAKACAPCPPMTSEKALDYRASKPRHDWSGIRECLFHMQRSAGHGHSLQEA